MTELLETESDSWDSYGKIYAIGHRAASALFDHEVTIEEKVDGSQFSFGIFDGKLKVRSRGRVFDVEAPDDMFRGACETVKRLGPMLRNGWTYRGEVLKGPKHNVLTYERAPEGNIILFDIAVGQQNYLNYAAKEDEAKRLGLEVVPILFQGKVEGQHTLDELKGRISILGGTPIEGYVVKSYDQFTLDKKVLMGKWVSEAFKEIHRKNYKPLQAGKGDISEMLAKKYKTVARWQKAVQHMAEDGTLQHEPKDIGPLIGAISKDLHDECIEEIKEDLFQAYWKKLAQNCVRGFAEWYKSELEHSAFE